MKKYLILLAAILICYLGDSQIIRPNPTTNFQQFGTPVTLTRINGLLYPAVGYAPALYADTAAINATYLKNVPLAHAATSDGKWWVRSYDVQKWLQVYISGISSPGIDDVLAVGQSLTANRSINLNSFNLGLTSGNVGIGTSTPAKVFHTVGTVRHGSLGTASSDTTTNKPLGIDSNGDVIPMTYWPRDGSSRFGVSGEDATAAQNRNFDLNSNVFNLTNGVISLIAAGDPFIISNSNNDIDINVSNGRQITLTSGTPTTNYSKIWAEPGIIDNETDGIFNASFSRAYFIGNTNTTTLKIIDSSNTIYVENASVGIGTSSPTAALHIKAGTASANTAPLKLTTGTSLTTAEAGAFEYTTPQLFFTNGAAVRQELFQGNQNFVQTQFDKTSNTTLGDVTNLSVNVAAGKAYRFEAILYTSSNVAGGVKAAIAGTATATTIIYEGLTTDAGLTTQSRATSLGTAVGGVTAVTAAYIKITGTIIVNAAGTLTVQFAQNASNGTASSVLVGSTFHVIEMAWFP